MKFFKKYNEFSRIILKLLLGLFLILVSVELVLRIGGATFLAVQNYRNNAGSNANAYRIITYGDSMTTNLNSGQSSWPEELELTLNNKSTGNKFKVFNLAVPGMSSYGALLNLDEDLKRYRPDMVITMIGSTDNNLAGLYKTENKGFIRKLRIYKVIEYLSDILNEKKEEIKKFKDKKLDDIQEEKLKKHLNDYPDDIHTIKSLFKLYQKNNRSKDIIEYADNTNTNNKDVITLLESGRGQAYLDLKNYSEAERWFLKSLETTPENILAIANIGKVYAENGKIDDAIKIFIKYDNIVRSLPSDQFNIFFEEDVYTKIAEYYFRRGNLSTAYNILSHMMITNPNKAEEVVWFSQISEKLNQTDQASNILQRIINENPGNLVAWHELGRYYLNHDKIQEAEDLFEKKFDLKPLKEARDYDKGAHDLNQSGLILESDEMRKKAMELRAQYYLANSEDNHVRIYKKLHKNGIKFIAMQYPLLDITQLKNRFNGDEDVIFVENKEYFQKALSNSSYNDYFLDNFGLYFGHPKKKGNQLIAENVADTVLKNLSH